jgi:steroid delta-isomerase
MSYAQDHVDAFEDAVLEFIGPPFGPFIGRAAILDAYIENPPDDTLEINGPVVVNGAELVVPYRWKTTGATGTMLMTAQSDEIAHLTVTFD